MNNRGYTILSELLNKLTDKVSGTLSNEYGCDDVELYEDEIEMIRELIEDKLI